jgi:hypothetical protein
VGEKIGWLDLVDGVALLPRATDLERVQNFFRGSGP